MAPMGEILSTLVPTRAIVETAVDHQSITGGDGEAHEMIMTGITLGADDTIGVGREATAGIVVEAAGIVDDVIGLEIVLGTDLAVGRGINRDLAAIQEIDHTNVQRISREIDPVIVPRLVRDLRIDQIDHETAATGMAEKATNTVRVPDPATAPAQPTLVKTAREMAMVQ